MSISLKRLMSACALAAFAIVSINAKDYTIGFTCDPDEAEVYINGRQVASSTPAMVSVSDKIATKTMMIQFKKEGYKSKTVTISYSKKELKNQPIVYAQLKKEAPKGAPQQAPVANDPTLRQGQMNQRVDRHSAGTTDMEGSIIRWAFDSDPRGAKVFWRVISSCPAEVKNTNESYLATTPYEETRGFNIIGLTYNNSRNVTIEVKVTKRGYEDQVKRFNVRQALDQQEISGFYELVPKEESREVTTRSKTTKTTTITEEETVQ